MCPNLVSEMTLILRTESNSCNSVVGEIALIKAVDMYLKDGPSKAVFYPTKDELEWRDPDWLHDVVHDVLYNDQGQPAAAVDENEYWMLSDCEGSVNAEIDYMTEISDSLDGLFVYNQNVLNSIAEGYIVTNVELVSNLPNQMVFSVMGAKVECSRNIDLR